ncbi:MAG: NUDIX hydrolase [Candidatus Eremiobacteraeota bacterium]|nr:NUDIX hydrolase [Candidatus Eremiobacteraeota bacterium]
MSRPPPNWPGSARKGEWWPSPCPPSYRSGAITTKSIITFAATARASYNDSSAHLCDCATRPTSTLCSSPPSGSSAGFPGSSPSALTARTRAATSRPSPTRWSAPFSTSSSRWSYTGCRAIPSRSGFRCYSSTQNPRSLFSDRERACVPSQEPIVAARQIVYSNRWVTLVRKDIQTGTRTEDYYTLQVPDYVAIVAVTPDGRLPLVRQYRPAVEGYTLELPAGTLEPGETPLECCRRELWEEVGLKARHIREVGSYLPDTGRLGNRQYIFHVQTEEPRLEFVREQGIEVSYHTLEELEHLIQTRQLDHLLHVSAVYLAGVLGA